MFPSDKKGPLWAGLARAAVARRRVEESYQELSSAALLAASCSGLSFPGALSVWLSQVSCCRDYRCPDFPGSRV